MCHGCWSLICCDGLRAFEASYATRFRICRVTTPTSICYTLRTARTKNKTPSNKRIKTERICSEETVLAYESVESVPREGKSKSIRWEGFVVNIKPGVKEWGEEEVSADQRSLIMQLLRTAMTSRLAVSLVPVYSRCSIVPTASSATAGALLRSQSTRLGQLKCHKAISHHTAFDSPGRFMRTHITQ